MMNLRNIATIVAIFLLPILGVSQQLIGNIIQIRNGFTNFRISADGKLIVVKDWIYTRTFKYTNNDWQEKKQIDDKNWFSFEISKNGKTLVGSLITNNITGESKIFVYDLNGDEWILRPDITQELFPQKTLGFEGYEFVISPDGNSLAIINYTSWFQAISYIHIWKFENNVWSKEFETILENCRRPEGQFDNLSKTLLINGHRQYGEDFSSIYFKFDSWKESQSKTIDYKKFGDVKLNKDGDMLNCIFSLNLEDTINAKVIVEKYHISNEKVELSLRQEIPNLLAYSNDFSGDGNCFVTGYHPYLKFNKVRVFKLVQDTFLEFPTNLISTNAELDYGYGVHLSDDCNTLALGIRPESGPFDYNSELRVYDISALQTAVKDWKVQKRLDLYPNPTLGLVEILGLEAAANITIYDIVGKLVKQIYTLDNVIDIEDLPMGIYIIKIQTKERTESHKIIKTE